MADVHDRLCGAVQGCGMTPSPSSSGGACGTIEPMESIGDAVTSSRLPRLRLIRVCRADEEIPLDAGINSVATR
jgi:hypothetical protein